MKKIFVSLFCSLLLLGSTFSVAQALTALAPSDGSVSYGDLYRQLEALQQQINEWQWKQNMGRSILPTPPTNSTPTPPIVNTNIVPSNALGTAMNVLDKSALILIAPDGNDSKPGSSLLIRWSAVGFTSGIKTISVYKGTTLVDTITRDVPATVTTYNWTIPSNFAIGDYRIELKDNTTGTKSALDEGLFRVNPTPTVLSTPTLTVVPAKYGVKVSWGAVTGANKYKVTQYLYNGQTVYEGSATSFTDGELDCNKTYKYTIRALGINGASSPESSHYSATTLSCTTADPIVKSLTLISPDDNIEYKAGSGANVYIRWISSGLTGTLTANLYKGGTLLKQIHTTLPIAQRSYNWTLPQDLTTGNYRIELKDNTTGMTSSGDEGLFSVSSGVSPITPPVIKVLSPNGREKYKIGDVVSVKWEAKNLPSQANNKVFLSIARYENGGPVMDMSIENGVANTGSYAWKIKNDIKPGLYTFRVMPFCSGNNQQTECSLYDDSNGTFEITANTYTGTPVKITYPNGKEKLEIGKTYTIKWTAKSFKSTADVQLGIIDTRYSSEGGNRSEKTIANIKNTGSYKWTVPSNIETLDFTDTSDPVYRIKLYVGNQEVNDFDASDNTFSIIDKRASNIKASLSKDTPKSQNIPLGGAGLSFLKFDVKNSGKEDIVVTGVKLNGIFDSTNLQNISVYDGTTLVGSGVVASNVSGLELSITPTVVIGVGSSKMLTVKADVGTDVRSLKQKINIGVEKLNFKIGEKKFEVTSNVKGNKMTIVSGETTQSPSIKVVSPNGGETFKMEDIVHMKWNISNASLFNNSKIELVVGDIPFCTLATPTMKNGDNLHDWKVSSSGCSYVGPGPGYKIRVSFMNGSSMLSDVSDTSFSIAPSVNAPTLQILSPNGGEKFEREKTMEIKWNATNYTGNVTLTLVDANRYPVMEIKSGILSSSGLYTWTIPTTNIYETNYRVLIQGGLVSGYQAPLDYSDNTFFISIPTTASSSLAKPTNLEFAGYEMSGTTLISKFWYTDNSVGEDGYHLYWGDGTRWGSGSGGTETGRNPFNIAGFDCSKPRSAYLRTYKGTALSEPSNTVIMTSPSFCLSSSNPQYNASVLDAMNKQLNEMREALLNFF